MNKQLFIYIFIFIISISIVFGNPMESMKPEDVVNTTYTESEAELDHININSYVILNDKFLTIDKVSEICNDISEKLEMKDTIITKESSEEFCEIRLSGTIDSEIKGTIILQSSKFQDFQESSIVVDIIETREEYDLSQLCDKIREILKSYGKVNLNINLAAYYDGVIDNRNLKKTIDRAFKEIDANEVEGIENDDLISITGYTPALEESLSYCGKKVNINMAARYNSYEDKTYIFIGTPLIVVEY
ncbi:YwmB family TATA-box binding protein [Wukongibacter baidiensis]|uniref:YwmB family TATA-box binding protein n=1 Tax=Wukongibacter baidiensis TaxID=1723361 RepID=UPI003D7F8CB6